MLENCVFPRCCDECRRALPADWDYALCKECGEANCVHGNERHECNECLLESDFAFDAAREEK
jgi:hypothetical protein